MIDWTAVAVILTALATVLGSIAARRKINSEAANEISEAAMSLLDPFRRRLEELETQAEAHAGQIDVLQSQVRSLQEENSRLWKGVEILAQQVVDLGHKPLWQPKKRED